jgi:hypothetical protein
MVAGSFVGPEFLHGCYPANAFVFALHNTYFAVRNRYSKGLEMTTLSKPSRFARVASAFAMFGAAVDVARAVESHRMPSARALKTLGIDENEFRQINVR